jgi:HlyD family secretion protein
LISAAGRALRPVDDDGLRLAPLLLLAVAALALAGYRLSGHAGEPAAASSAGRHSAVEEELLEPGVASRFAGWRWIAVVVAVAALAFGAYRMWFSGGSAQGPPETAPVTRVTIVSMIEAAASVESRESADLSFGTAGRVAGVMVALGDRVTAGQTLAVLESGALDNGVLAAEAQLQLARLRLTQMLNGASSAEIAAAEQAVSSARVTRDKTADDLRRLEDGPDAAELAAARARVTNAAAALAESERVRDRLLDGASDAEVAAAEANVAAAAAALSSAERAADDAAANVSAADAKLHSVRLNYCQHAAARAEVCSSTAVPLAQSLVDLLVADAASTSDTDLAADIAALLNANAACVAAAEAATAAAGAVDVAEANLAAAEDALAALLDGPDAVEIQAAEAAVVAAQDGLDAAQAALADLEAGASLEELALASGAVGAADDAVTAAEAKLADLLDGADPDDVAIQRAQIAAAEIAVASARVQQADARLVAPFDGVVAAVNAHAGEYWTPASPAFVLLTPGALRLTLVIGENDRPYVRAGQQGTVTFEALRNQSFGFTIERVGDAPRIEQGVAIYDAEATLDIGDATVRPVPGISGVAEVLIEEKGGVLAIPTRALRRIGKSYVVDVLVDGAIVEREVEPGISDGQFVEVIAGLREGEQVVIRTAASSAPQALPTRERRLPGDIR